MILQRSNVCEPLPLSTQQGAYNAAAETRFAVEQRWGQGGSLEASPERGTSAIAAMASFCHMEQGPVVSLHFSKEARSVHFYMKSPIFTKCGHLILKNCNRVWAK